MGNGGVTAAAAIASIASWGSAAPEAADAAGTADASLAAGAGADASAGTAAAVGAGAADAGTAAGLGSGLLAGTSGTALGGGALAANLGATGAMGAMGGAGAFGGAAAGATGALGGASAFGGGLAGYDAAIAGGGAIGANAGATGAIGASAAQDAAGMGTAATSANDFGMAAPLTTAQSAQAGTFAPLAANTAPAVSGPVGFGGGAMTGTQSGMPWLSRINTALKGANAAYSAANINNPGGTQTPMAPVARAPMAGRGVQNQMPIPSALPSMTNPGQTMEAMPDAGGMSLPTAGNSYQTLLSNMLTNEMRSPMSGLGVGTTSYMPGGGGMMNPSTIIPGMY
jgi:hypothetical protein